MSRADSRSLKRPQRLVKLHPNLARLSTQKCDATENADRINTCMSRHNIFAHDSARDVRKLRANPDQRGATSKHPLMARPASHAGAGAAATSPMAEANRKQDLAELVWKYFGEEITQALTEAQKALTPEQSGSMHQVSHRKR
jgi:hypothetical protein